MADDVLTARDKLAFHLSLAGYRQPVAIAELLLAEHRAEIAAEVRGYASVMHHVSSRALLERVADDIETGKEEPLPTPATQASASPTWALRITVSAPTPADAERWTRGIRDMVTAEFGDSMRLSFDAGPVLPVPSTGEGLP